MPKMDGLTFLEKLSGDRSHAGAGQFTHGDRPSRLLLAMELGR